MVDLKKEALLEELVEELSYMYFDFKPDDTSFLADNPSIIEQMGSIETSLIDEDMSLLNKLKLLIDFNHVWFPNNLEYVVKKEYIELLDRASYLTKSN